MILIDTKTDKSVSASKPNLLLLDGKTTTVSFSDLLNVITAKTSDTKEKFSIDDNAIKVVLDFTDNAVNLKDKKSNNKELINITQKFQLSNQEQNIDTEQKIDFINSFLDTKTLKKPTVNTDTLSKDISILNPTITQETDVEDIKLLIGDAKEYLKNKIIDSDGYKKSTTKEIPKTLSGLKELAKVYDIDVSKITLEEVQTKVDTKTLENVDAQKIKLVQPEVKKEEIQQKVKQVQNEVKTDTLKVQPQQEETQQIQKDKPVERLDAQKVKQVQNEVKTDTLKVQPQQEEVQQIQKEDVKQKTAQTKSMVLLFKEPSDVPKVQHTTEELVQIKQLKIQNKDVKQKTDNLLNSLISGEKISKQETAIDISLGMADKTTTVNMVNTTKVNSNEISLESILQQGVNDDVSDDATESKTTTLNVNKADSFEVKLNEAKQMVKYLSQDIKNSIDEYKSPFTRIKLQLNPKNMGEVDLTVVQRGKNLHINLSSNNVAINTLSQNINELKVQLNNNGINNASLNFSNNSQSSEQSSSGHQQQHSHNGNRARDEYDFFNNEDNNEEVLSSLEIIVPRYV